LKKSAKTMRPKAAPETRPTAARARVLVLRAPGVNCDRETAHAFERCGAEVAVLHVNRLVEDRAPLDGANVLVIPGGFSFGDDLGAGKVFGNKLALKLRGSVLRLVDRGGLVLGICNGFQVLVRAGILPGTRGVFEQEATLARNLSGKFESRWTRCLAVSAKTPFLEKDEVIDLPVAHGEGRFVPADESVLERMRQNGQIALVYRQPPADEHPGVSGWSLAPGAASYPWNPSGTTLDIAGITDPTGQVLGLMPHPERHQDTWQRPGHAREVAQSGRARVTGSPREGEARSSAAPKAAGLAVFRRAVEHVTARLKGGLA
jgi:phosphoribosylformylglycinamidine synthase